MQTKVSSEDICTMLKERKRKKKFFKNNTLWTENGEICNKKQ